MDLSIPVVDSEIDDHWRSVPRQYWPRRQAPADLEQFLRERAKKKEKRYFELLSVNWMIMLEICMDMM